MWTYPIFKIPFHYFAFFLTQILAITSSRAVSVVLPVFWVDICRHFCCVCGGVEMLGHRVCVCCRFLPPRPYRTWRLLYSQCSHPGGCVVVCHCGFNLYFILPGCDVRTSNERSHRRHMLAVTSKRDSLFTPLETTYLQSLAWKSRVL